MDFAGPFEGKMILIVIDSHSKWIEAFPTKPSTSVTVIQLSRTLFAQFGVPKVVVTDNGSCFVSEEFLLKNGIKHTTSTPYHPSTNSLAEHAVQIVKRVLKNMKTIFAKVMMAYRVSPQSTTGESPALLLQKHQIRTRLDLLKPGRNEHVEHCQQKQKAEHDASARQYTFSQGEVVYTRNFGTGPRWLPGVFQKFQVLSHLVKLADGRLVRCHHDHIRCRLTSADREQSTETSQEVPEVLEELVPIASNEASTSSLALPLEDSATSSDQDSPAEDTSSPSITETSIVDQSSVIDSTAEGLSESIVTGNSIPSVQNSKTYPRRLCPPPDWYQPH